MSSSAASPKLAAAHFMSKLSFETDPSDVHADLKKGAIDFILVDARSPEAYAREHLPGAINLWHKTLDAKATAGISKEKVLLTYCNGVSCNASTKSAAKLAALGFRVKEIIGGIDAWKQEGYSVETGASRRVSS